LKEEREKGKEKAERKRETVSEGTVEKEPESKRLLKIF